MPCREPGTARCARENRRQPASAAPSSPHHSRVSAIAPARPGRACASPACLRRALVLGMDTCRTPRHLSRRPGIGLYGGGMSSWWHRDMIAPGKLPLMLCFLAFVVTFVVTRTITRMIRDGRGPFRNRVTASGTHIHHSVPGIILLIIGAFTAVGGPDSLGWRSFAAVAGGIGTSLVLDEFALILHRQGRLLERRGPAVGRGGKPDGRLPRAGPGWFQSLRDNRHRQFLANPAPDGERDLHRRRRARVHLRPERQVPDGAVRALPAAGRGVRRFAPRAAVVDLGPASLRRRAPGTRDPPRRRLRQALDSPPDRLGKLHRRKAVPAKPAGPPADRRRQPPLSSAETGVAAAQTATSRRSAPCPADRVGVHAAPGQRQP